MQPNDLHLLEAVQGGNENTFEMIFKEYYQPLCRYAQTFLADKDEAEEVVQAAFLGFWEKRQSIMITVSLKAYLFQMVRNRCLNVLKHEKIKQQHAEHESHFIPRHEPVAESILSVELEQRIQVAIAQLPEQCRLVFTLSRFEELKYQEIANQLNISIKTVESQMGKALKIMRDHLRDYLPFLIIFLNNLFP